MITPSRPGDHETSVGPWLILLACCLLGALAAYHRILGTPMVLDDYYLIGHLSDGIEGMWSGQQFHHLRPVTGLFLWFDHAVWGINPLGYHLTNVLFHGATAFLVAGAGNLVLLACGYDRWTARLTAWIGAAIFLFLPSHAEPVSWISARTDVIAAFFCLASLCTYLLARATMSPIARWAAVLLFGIAVLTKESPLGFPLVLVTVELFLHRVQPGPPDARWIPRVAPFFAILALYPLARWLALGEFVGGQNAKHVVFEPSLLARAFFDHLGGSFAPLASPSLSLGLLWFIGVAWLITVAWRGPASAAASLLLAIFILSLLPVINLEHARHGEDERFVYLPSAFSALLLAVLVSRAALLVHAWAPAVVTGVLVIGGAWSLDRSGVLWNQAGHLTGRVVASVPALPAERLVVLIMPRILRSAWMLGNGLEGAQTLYGWTSPTKFRTWTKVDLLDPSDRVEVFREGNVWRMRLVGSRSPRSLRSFKSAFPGRLLSEMELNAHRAAYAQATGRSLGPDWGGIWEPSLEPGDRLAVYTAGRLEAPLGR